MVPYYYYASRPLLVVKRYFSVFFEAFLRCFLRLAEITFRAVDELEHAKPCAFQERPHLPFFWKEIVADGPGAHVVFLDLLTAQGMRDDQSSIGHEHPVHLLQGQVLVRKMWEGAETDDMMEKFSGERERFDGRQIKAHAGFTFKFLSADLSHLRREINGPDRPLRPDCLKK